MRIKRLEIYGFKSFPQRVVLPFPPGISAIVGPNGSGKSNIIDALRWILGEQNPRLLRVREMTDLIFAGENGRRPEFAEVCLVLEKEPEEGPKEWASLAEISVVRRLYRDGESEFFINNRPCRLKDIVYLFLDTGAHARGYGIIDQGQVGQFVEQSPKERRRFLEELAGIARYKLKREETERQINRSRENLTRVKDILVEVEARLAELEKQAEKARAFLKLQEEIRDLELARLHLLFLETDEKLKGLETKISRLRERISVLQEEKARLLPERDEKLAKLELLRLKIERYEASLRQKEEELEEKEKTLRELLQKEAHLAKEVAQLKGQLSSQTERVKTLRWRLKEVQEEKRRAELEIKEKEAEIHRLREANRGLLEKKKRLEEELKELRERVFTLKHTEAIQKKEEVRFKEEERRTKEELERLARERKALKERREGLHQEREKLEREKARLLEEKSSLKQEKTALLDLLEEKEKEWEKVREEVSLLRLKLRGLNEEIRWLKAFLAERRSEAAKILQQAGIKAPFLFEVVQLEPKEEKIVEQAFPPLLEALWLPEREKRDRALTLLKQKKISALIFSGEDPSQFLRKRISGIEWSEELPAEPSGPVVTPQGLFFEGDGLWHVRGEDSSALLTRRRELVSKEEDLARYERELSSREEQKKALRKEIDRLRGQKEELYRRQKELENRLNRLEEKRKRLLLEEEKLQQREGLLREQEEERKKGLEELRAQLARLEKELLRLKEQKEKYLPRLGRLEDELRLREKEIKAALAKVRALELSVSAARERLKQATKEEERLLKEEGRLVKELERKRENEILWQEDLKRLREERSSWQRDLEEKKKEILSLREKLAALKREGQKLEEELGALNKRLEEISGELNRSEKRLHRLEVDQAELDLTRKHLREQAQERFSEDLPLAQEPLKAPLGEIETRLRAQKARLKDFGAVNLAAIEELEKTKERKQFLLEQKADLEKAISDLEAAVRQINRTCRERLREALGAANEKLALVFPLLFPGGQAELRFTESDDPLEAGLDLLVRLPGKPIRHLAMLSGGEKALTALAVLCAFYLVKPGPFCVLDEVDAPLDEANTERFNQLLEELVKHAQIILVTHNKRVMEVAHALFGVTMEEKGVSKIVSVRLT